eukprot:66423-Hanusia_phi.AAC.1
MEEEEAVQTFICASTSGAGEERTIRRQARSLPGWRLRTSKQAQRETSAVCALVPCRVSAGNLHWDWTLRAQRVTVVGGEEESERSKLFTVGSGH